MGQSGNPDGIFYMYPQNGVDSTGKAKFDHSKIVAAKYLTIGGQKVPDPYFTGSGGGSNQNTLYSKLNSDGTIDETSVTKNIGNYLIVLANYNILEAVKFASKVNADMAAADRVSPVLGRDVGEALMAWNFQPYGGGQDIQRGTKWGVPRGETNPVFKDAASWNFGFVSQQVNIPTNDAEWGGGVLNHSDYNVGQILKALHIISRNRHKGPDGPFGLSMGDALNFAIGVHAPEELGFHETVIQHTQPDLGSFAPYFRGERLDVSHAKPRSHSADNGVHAAIINAMGRSPLPQVEASHAFSNGSGLSAVVQKGRFGEPAKNFTDISAALWSYPDQFAFFKRPVTGGNDPFQVAPTSAGTALMHFQPGITSGPISDGFLGAGQTHVFELPSFAPVKQNVGQVSTRLSKTPHLSDEGAFSPGTSYRSAQRATVRKAVASRAMDHWEAGAPDTPHSSADVVDERRFGRALREFFDQEARLPPSGATGFDPRLSPAWPGLKLPA